MDDEQLKQLMEKALSLTQDVANGKTSGSDVADKLEFFAKTIRKLHGTCTLGRECVRMAKKARGE